MLSPSEGKEIHERVMAELESGRGMTPEDVAALMQAAESGYAPAQNAYANVLSNVEGNLLAALPWYCKASQQGDEEALNTLRELYTAETLVREHVGEYLTVEQLIALRKRKVCSEENGRSRGVITACFVAAALAIGHFFPADDSLCLILCVAGFAIGLAAEWLFLRLAE